MDAEELAAVLVEHDGVAAAALIAGACTELAVPTGGDVVRTVLARAGGPSSGFRSADFASIVAALETTDVAGDLDELAQLDEFGSPTGPPRTGLEREHEARALERLRVLALELAKRLEE